MCERFSEWESDIRNYCKENGLNFEKAKKMSKCQNKDTLVLQYYEEGSGSGGLLDETPMPVVLWVYREKSGPRFEQTEYTRKYLAQ